jgi:hypothetical protein
LTGSSEKIAKEQNKKVKHPMRSRSSENEMSLPPAVLNRLNSSVSFNLKKLPQDID